MQTSLQPKLLPIPFADTGSKQNIPDDSQIGITAGRASYTDGFPPLTRTPLAAGGVPPFGTDFNGVLYDITAALRWSQSGAGYPFNTNFNTAVNGYPKGARIPTSTLDGYWLNTVDGNTNNPEVSGSTTTGWVPSGFYGTTTITGLSGSSITLTTLQAGRDRITLAGTLTANINLVVPAWVKRWEVVNNCVGAFSVTIKTTNGSGVSVQAGTRALVQGDGNDIIQGGSPGCLLNIQVFTASSTYIMTPGAKTIKVIALGGGGGGGGTAITNSTQVSSSSGGNGGTYGESRLISANAASGVSVTVGAGGAGVAGFSGTTGGTSSFGAFISSPGGSGGGAGGASSSSGSLARDGIAQGPSTGSSVAFSSPGAVGGGPIALSNSAGAIKSGKGGDSIFGSGGAGITGSFTAVSATGFGAGGGGNAVGTGSPTPVAGGAGSSGIVIVEEYS